MPTGISVDESGNYCGKSVETGELVKLDPSKVGYCGPDCKHCAEHKFYVPQDGVWVCAADWDYEEL